MAAERETLNEQWSGRRSSRGSVWGDCEPAEHPPCVGLDKEARKAGMRNNGRGARNFDRARHRCADSLPRLFKPNQDQVRHDFSNLSLLHCRPRQYPIPAFLPSLENPPNVPCLCFGPLLALAWPAEGAREGLVAELDGHFAAGLCQLKWTRI